MEKLVDLPSVGRLSKNVIRILGQNPGKYTLQGTNTYLVGQRNPFVLVDAGQGIDSYTPLLREALETHASEKGAQLVSDIIITHRHGDHIGGLPSVLNLVRTLWNENNGTFVPPRVHKFPLSSPDETIDKVLQSLPVTDVTPSSSGNLLHDLQDGQKIATTTTSSESTDLIVVHTPGHTPDSICLYFKPDQALFTADTILGQGTAVFEDLGVYMSSLRKLLDFNRESPYTVLYPGHGPEVTEGSGRIATYLQHRVDRENQVIQVLTSKNSVQSQEDSIWTTWDIVGVIYKDYPQSLWEPAAHGVDLHLRKLESEGKVRVISGDGKDKQWLFIR
ncbi:hypothetical protein QCA50_007659 [Cerrena zonata]|uniref:Metallo-beta-lactamase domain-containing protein n=1 Tax=Cerrena zonata TaxID=2478898 RepID=A0AAW0GFT5_9APHY